METLYKHLLFRQGKAPPRPSAQSSSESDGRKGLEERQSQARFNERVSDYDLLLFFQLFSHEIEGKRYFRQGLTEYYNPRAEQWAGQQKAPLKSSTGRKVR